MKLKMIDGIEVDLDDELSIYFFHEYIQWKRYQWETYDIRTKLEKNAFRNIYKKRADTGGWNFAADDVYKFDDNLWKLPNECNTMCISNKQEDHDTLLIQLSSLATHELRLTMPFHSTSTTIYNLNADILPVTEDPLRFPESIYPSNFNLGCSERLNTLSLMANDIRRIMQQVNKNYKNVVVYSDSKLAGAGISLAIELNDIVTSCFIIHGITTHDFNKSPIVNMYLNDNNLHLTPTQYMHIIKSYQYTHKHDVPKQVLDPISYIKEHNINVEYYYGKYDDEYKPFLDYTRSIDTNINYHEVDYKTTDNNTHRIRTYVDRFILSEYINSL